MKAKILPGQLMSKQVKDSYQRYVNRLAETQNKCKSVVKNCFRCALSGIEP